MIVLLRSFLTGAMALWQLWNSGGCQPATQHALQPLPSTLSGTEAGSDESRIIWQAHQICIPWTSDSKTWHSVRLDCGQNLMSFGLILTCWSKILVTLSRYIYILLYFFRESCFVHFIVFKPNSLHFLFYGLFRYLNSFATRMLLCLVFGNCLKLG